MDGIDGDSMFSIEKIALSVTQKNNPLFVKIVKYFFLLAVLQQSRNGFHL